MQSIHCSLPGLKAVLRASTCSWIRPHVTHPLTTSATATTAVSATLDPSRHPHPQPPPHPPCAVLLVAWTHCLEAAPQLLLLPWLSLQLRWRSRALRAGGPCREGGSEAEG